MRSQKGILAVMVIPATPGCKHAHMDVHLNCLDVWHTNGYTVTETALFHTHTHMHKCTHEHYCLPKHFVSYDAEPGLKRMSRSQRKPLKTTRNQMVVTGILPPSGACLLLIEVNLILSYYIQKPFWFSGAYASEYTQVHEHTYKCICSIWLSIEITG